MIKKLTLLIIFACFLQISCIAQLFVKSTPKGIFQKDIPEFIMPQQNINELLKQDAEDIKNPDIPFRFGIDIITDIDIIRDGKLTVTNDSMNIWQLKISSENAFSLNFIFDKYYIPDGGNLFIFNPENNNILGAFTSANNRKDSIFSTTIIKGNSVVIEYNQKNNITHKPVLHLSRVIHAYKDIFKIAKGYGSSGICNNNINCPEGIPWSLEKRAVAMILTQYNTRICTGTLVNNVRQDSIPYFLTAKHCLGSESTWIFMFNYESPGCENQDGNTDKTIQGATLIASDTPSDFALLRLDDKLPSSFNVYYAGWSAIDEPSANSVCIHHPSGDVKKITFDFDTTTSTAWSSGVLNSHWTIQQWEDGTTEPGSSGSPLFNSSHQVIGQLHGGSASCSNISDDNYGKFSYSWESNSASNKQLKYWLDPDSTGVMSINGRDFSSPLYNIDANLAMINSPPSQLTCTNPLTPEVIVFNKGADTINSITFNINIDGSSEIYTWNGQLAYGEYSSIALPAINFSDITHILSVKIENVNGYSDDNPENDTISTQFIYNNTSNIIIHTDNDYTDNYYQLFNAYNTLISSGTCSTADSDNIFTLCLDYGCYNLYVYDYSGNGIMNGDSGYVSIYYKNYLIGQSDGNFTGSTNIGFCLNSYDIETFEFNIFPNPSTGKIFINGEFNALSTPICNIYNTRGQLVLSQELAPVFLNYINIESLSHGLYFVHIYDGLKKYSQKIIHIKP